MNTHATTTVILLVSLVGIVAVIGIIKGVVGGKPPGQKGIKGTWLEHNQVFRWIQIALLGVLALGCLGVLLVLMMT